MSTYMEKVNELRAAIDFEINSKEDIDLTSAELVEKARMIEDEMSLEK